MPKSSTTETTFAKLEAVQSQLANLAAAEALNAADNAAKDLKLRAELLELNKLMAPLARWREKLDLLAIQRAHVLQKRNYAVDRHAAFEVDLRAAARADTHQDFWFVTPHDGHLNGQFSERMIGFLNRDLAAIDADAAGINAGIAAFEKLHGISQTLGA